MASISKMMITKDGRRYWKIQCYHGKGLAPYSCRFYWPIGYCKTAAERELNKDAAEFQRRCESGEYLNREERKQAEAAERAKREAVKTVKQYGECIFMPAKQQSITENTRLSYQTNLDKHIYPVIGDVLLTEVTSAMITKLLLSFRNDNHSYGSTVKVYNVLNGLFTMAFLDDSIPFNPMIKVKHPQQSKEERAVTEVEKAFSAEELNYIFDCVAKEPLKWQAFIYLAADTAARRGELTGLRWSDVDLKKGLVVFKHNLQYSKQKGVYDIAPKGGKYRTVDIGDDTIALLKSYKEQIIIDRLSSDEKSDIISFQAVKDKQEIKIPEYVFTADGTDDPMFPTSPTRYFRIFGDRYNIPGFHPHLLRHTSASLSLTNGGDVKSIADRLGHKDASVTLRMYAHASNESIRAAGQAVRDALKKKREEQLKKENAGA